MGARSRLCIVALQDWFALDADLRTADPAAERVNTPGTVGGANWAWRMKPSLEELKTHPKLTAQVRGLSTKGAGNDQADPFAHPDFGPGALTPAAQEFHIARKVRDFYGFDDGLFSITGNVVFANFLATRIFSQKMNEKRDLVHHPDQAVLPGHVNAMGLIDEILHFVAGLYREEFGSDLWGRALDFIALKNRTYRDR